ncbi:MAG: helix-turn-helix transcriptional regulator [Clostridiales bacterium]|nr:helix-turn-helix transcriptional regulator [Clostridiales bacterium]
MFVNESFWNTFMCSHQIIRIEVTLIEIYLTNGGFIVCFRKGILLIARLLSVRRMPVDAQKVGKRIQEVRKARGLTQAELSQMLDLSTKYISNIECGFKTPNLNTFVAIANALKCDANQLLSDVLDVTTGQESGQVSEKLLSLPAEEQRRILRVLEVMIGEAR